MTGKPSLLEQPGEDLVATWLHGEYGELGECDIDRWLFLCNSPCSQMPPAEMARLIPAELHAALEQDARLRGFVDAVLRRKMGWDISVPWAPEDPLWEASLLQPGRFDRLAMLAGASRLRQHLARIVDGASVRALRKRMGSDVLECALLGAWREPTFPLDADAGLPDGENPVECVERAARACIEKAFSSRSRELQMRIACKFPGCFAEGASREPPPFAAEAEYWLSALWKKNGAWL